MKQQLLGILVASLFTIPVVAKAASAPAPVTPISPTSSSTSTANGGAGGVGGAANGGAATGGAATGGSALNTVSGTTANGNSSTVSISVSLPSRGNGDQYSNGLSGSGSGAESSSNGGSGTGSKSTATSAAADPVATIAHVDYGGTYTVKSAPPVTAPSLTTTLSDTCMGSVSFGLSLTGFGATAASTMVDQACVRRLDSREFRAMGLNDVALALLCQSDANRKAVEATGHDCPGSVRPAIAVASNATVQKQAPNNELVAADTTTDTVQAAVTVSSVTSASNADSNEFRDPLIRRRLGLEPLQASSAAK
ncbi:histidine kinase [Glaciimonas immobilis]|uniref:Chemotaxis protein CheA n=1 Tax=Glaciimonas immobilis TaxID=728004 RepID=A0A840RUA9_9BURK|nr:histidine kinase [Glaciimonas immobilis]KAF3999982.1 histidine kinase [Glaciimonas immobilis]MBB5200486.1 hypothetical protein [Glaciimonas immobilis]